MASWSRRRVVLLRKLLGFCLALGLLMGCFREVPLASVLVAISAVGPALALVLVPQLVGLTLETWGWRAVLRQVGHAPNFGDLWKIRVGTEALGQLLPGGALIGESVKPTLLERHAGLPIPVGVAATLHRKYVRLLAHGVYVIVGSIIGWSTIEALSQSWLGVRWLPVVLVLVGVGLLLGAVGLAQLLGRAKPAQRLYVVLAALPIEKLRLALSRRALGFHEADRHTKAFFEIGGRRLLLPVGACTIAWFCEALESWLILELLGVAFGLDPVLGFELVISLARQLLILVPAGLGVQEAGYTMALSELGSGDVVTWGAAFVIIKRMKELFWGALGLGLLALLRGGARASHLPRALPSHLPSA